MQKLLYAAVDVDDRAFHVAVVDATGSEVVEFACKPSAAALVSRLEKIAAKRNFRLCYEATYLGFALARQLIAKGIDCQVVASSLIPTINGKRQKNDRIDSRKLATFFAKGLLTAVHMPGDELECDRDLVRSRAFICAEMASIKIHIVSFCRRRGWDFRAETKLKSYWSKSHLEWLERKASNEKMTSTKVSLLAMLRLLRQFQETIATFDSEIEALAQMPRYVETTKALICYRGFQTTTAMTIATELGDIRRFDHPRRLTAYCGLDVVEYSSGGKERRYGIAKTGNRFVRTALVEACQFALAPPKVSHQLRRRREESKQTYKDIADRAMLRLHKKGTRLLYRDKPRNKIKTALAREILGFVWESMREAAGLQAA